MSFRFAKDETRERYSETRSLLTELRKNAPPPLQPLTEIQKTHRGLWLVSLYAAVERSVNVTVEAALREISVEKVQSNETVASIHSIFHFPKVQSLRTCGWNSLFDRSVELLEASSGSEVLETTDNPLAPSLQNVDGNTMRWVLKLFGAPEMEPSPAALGRTSTLRERRNAVAHGREAAAKVGERYTIDELGRYYDAADEVTTAFIESLEQHCTSKNYIRASA